MIHTDDFDSERVDNAASLLTFAHSAAHISTLCHTLGLLQTKAPYKHAFSSCGEIEDRCGKLKLVLLLASEACIHCCR